MFYIYVMLYNYTAVWLLLLLLPDTSSYAVSEVRNIYIEFDIESNVSFGTDSSASSSLNSMSLALCGGWCVSENAIYLKMYSLGAHFTWALIHPIVL